MSVDSGGKSWGSCVSPPVVESSDRHLSCSSVRDWPPRGELCAIHRRVSALSLTGSRLRGSVEVLSSIVAEGARAVKTRLVSSTAEVRQGDPARLVSSRPREISEARLVTSSFLVTVDVTDSCRNRCSPSAIVTVARDSSTRMDSEPSRLRSSRHDHLFISTA